MSKLESPCHYCGKHTVDCHSNCKEYKDYCDENARLNHLLYEERKKDAEYLGYTHHKKQKKKR